MAEADSKLARFVGLDAYHEAGGTTQSDLFGDAVYLENPGLLNELAAAKLDAVRQELEAEGWGWVEVSPERDLEVIHSLRPDSPAAGRGAAGAAGAAAGRRAELEDIADEADARGRRNRMS